MILSHILSCSLKSPLTTIEEADYLAPLYEPHMPQPLLDNFKPQDATKIGECDYNDFDSYKQQIEGKESLCEKLEEDKTFEGVFVDDEARSLREL